MMVLTRASSSRLGTPLASPLADPERPVNPVSSSGARHGFISARDRVLALRRLSADSSKLSSPTGSASTTASSPPSPIPDSSLELSQFSLLHSQLKVAQPRSPPSPLPHNLPTVDIGLAENRMVTPKRVCKPSNKRSDKAQTPGQVERTSTDPAPTPANQFRLDAPFQATDDPGQISPIPQPSRGLDIVTLKDPKDFETLQDSQLEQAPSETMREFNLEQILPEPMPDLQLEQASSDSHLVKGPLAPLDDSSTEQESFESIASSYPKQPPFEAIRDSHFEQPVSESAPDSLTTWAESVASKDSSHLHEAKPEPLQNDAKLVPLEPITPKATDGDKCRPLEQSCPEPVLETTGSTSTESLLLKGRCLEAIRPDTLEAEQPRPEEVQNEFIKVHDEEGQNSSLAQTQITEDKGLIDGRMIQGQNNNIEDNCPKLSLFATVEQNSTVETAMASELAPEDSDPVHHELQRIEQDEAPSLEKADTTEPMPFQLLGPPSVDQAETKPAAGKLTKGCPESLEETRQDGLQPESCEMTCEAFVEAEPISDAHEVGLEVDESRTIKSASELIATRTPGHVLGPRNPAQPLPELIQDQPPKPELMSVAIEDVASEALETLTPALEHPSPYRTYRAANSGSSLELETLPDRAVLPPTLYSTASKGVGKEEAHTVQSDSTTLDGQTEHTTSPQVASVAPLDEEEEDHPQALANWHSRSRSSFCSTLVGDNVEESAGEASDSDAQLESLLRKARERCRKGPVAGNAFVEGLDKIEFEEAVVHKPRSVQGQPLTQLARPLTLDPLVSFAGSCSTSSAGTSALARDMPKDRFGMMPPPIKKKGEGGSKKVGWHELPLQEITPQVKQEIQAMRLHGTLDPKCFVKGGIEKRLKEPIPERFQFGHVIPSGRSSSTGTEAIPKKRSFVEALVADEEAKAWAKKKYVNEVQVAGASGGKGFWKGLKKKRRRG